MKTILTLCGLLALGGVARAGEPDGPAAGNVLVLDNDRTLEGEVERVGEEYLVKRSGGITRVPAEKVLRLCASRKEALELLRRRANLSDPDERLRLARWCHLQDLRDEAVVEAREAVKLRPDHEESRRLLRLFEDAVKHAAEATRPASPGLPEPRPETPSVDLNAEAVNLFATKVQPILMNACARCHLHEDGGPFRLERAHGASVANRRALQQNLTAVLAQVNLRQPDASPFLVKARSAHGPSSEAPLSGRQLVAFETLQKWVRLTVAGNPHLKDRLSASSADLVEALEPPPTATRPDPGRTPPPKPAASPAPQTPAVQTEQPAPVGKAEEPPAPEPAEVGDEYSVAPFNRQMHPGRPPK